jgi:hypothetical protein
MPLRNLRPLGSAVWQHHRSHLAVFDPAGADNGLLDPESEVTVAFAVDAVFGIKALFEDLSVVSLLLDNARIPMR